MESNGSLQNLSGLLTLSAAVSEEDVQIISHLLNIITSFPEDSSSETIRHWFKELSHLVAFKDLSNNRFHSEEWKISALYDYRKYDDSINYHDSMYYNNIIS